MDVNGVKLFRLKLELERLGISIVTCLRNGDRFWYVWGTECPKFAEMLKSLKPNRHSPTASICIQTKRWVLTKLEDLYWNLIMPISLTTVKSTPSALSLGWVTPQKRSNTPALSLMIPLMTWCVFILCYIFDVRSKSYGSLHDWNGVGTCAQLDLISTHGVIFRRVSF